MNEYIDNNRFTELMGEYHIEYKKSQENNTQKPILKEEPASMLLLLAKRLATKGNFAGYIFKEELIGDAIENMLRYAHNFNPEKGKAFGYFTRIALFAFFRRIAREKKLFRTKVKLVQEMPLYHVMDARQSHDGDIDYQNNYIEYLNDYYNSNIVAEEEEKEKLKKIEKRGKVDKLRLSKAFK